MLKTDVLERSHEAYQLRRAQDKYEGKVEKSFPLKEFRKCSDYLAVILDKTTFDGEDLGDMVRVALWKSGRELGE